jgi:hypothetical protein
VSDVFRPDLVDSPDQRPRRRDVNVITRLGRALGEQFLKSPPLHDLIGRDEIQSERGRSGQMEFGGAGGRSKGPDFNRRSTLWAWKGKG